MPIEKKIIYIYINKELHTLISIFEKKFLENWKGNDNFFNFRENVYKNRKFNVCPKDTLWPDAYTNSIYSNQRTRNSI